MKDKKVLTSLHWRVYEFLKHYCKGQDNAISMLDLAKNYAISSRKVREIIKDLTEDENIFTSISTSKNGYFIPMTEQEMEDGNRLLKSRLEGALTRYFANTPNDRHWLYNLLRQLETKYDTPPQAQGVIQFTGNERETVNYFGERKDERYNDLFEFSHS